VLIAPVWDTNCKIQNLKKNKTSNIKPTKYNLVYQAIPKKLVEVDKLQTTFKGAEWTKIYSVRRKAIPDIYNYVTSKSKMSGVVVCAAQLVTTHLLAVVRVTGNAQNVTDGDLCSVVSTD